MTPDDTALTSLARAYALSEILPLEEPRVREALDGAGTLEEAVDVKVTPTGLRAEGADVLDGDGSVSELARDLRIAGVERFTVPASLSRDAAEDLLRLLRGAVEGDDSVPAPPEALGAVPGITFEFATAPVSGDADALSAGGLFPEEELGASAEEELGASAESGGTVTPGDDPAPAPEVPDLEELVARFLDAEPEERAALEEELRGAAEEARRLGALDIVAEVVERLALAGEDPSEAPHLSLAVDLLRPGVAARVASHLGAIRDEVERERMIRVAAALGNEMSTALSEALVDESDRAARRAYLEALIALGDRGRAEAEKMLEDGRWFVVRNAATIFGGVGTEEDVQHLTSALAHEDARVRRETVLALARIGGEDAGMLLLGMVEDADADVRAAVANALGALEVERAGRLLLEALGKEDQEKVQVAILRALGALGDPGAVSAIEKRAVAGFFSRPAVPVRIAAYRALARIGTPHAVKLVEEAREDRDEDVRTAVRALLEMKREKEKERQATASDEEEDSVEAEDT